MTTPEAGRVEDAALIMQRARGDQATIEAAQRLSAALTTQAETIRGLDNVLIIRMETIRQAQETIRRLEGESEQAGKLADALAADVETWKQRAEAAEGLLKTFLVSQPGHTCQGAPACPICSNPATGEGA